MYLLRYIVIQEQIEKRLQHFWNSRSFILWMRKHIGKHTYEIQISLVVFFSFLLCFLYSTLILMLFLCKKILMKETFFASNIAVVNFHIYRRIKYYTTYRYIKWHTTSAPFWYETQNKLSQKLLLLSTE